MLSDDLLVDFIELNEVGPPQGKVFKQFGSLELATHEVGCYIVLGVQGLLLGEGLGNQGAGDSPALEGVVVVSLGHGDDDHRVVHAVVEDAPDQFLLVLVEEYHAFGGYR